MRIHRDFIGGNITVKDISTNEIYLENELRDTTTDWFYWAFCVEDAQNKTLTFKFQNNRLGYFGPAVSYDLIHWQWLDSVDGNSFTYSFKENESQVYFAHSMLYHPERFKAFAKSNNIKLEELCKGYKGSSIPCIKFGDGEISIILTSRHHACESTGNYVLEGVLEELIKNPIPNAKVFCVPFVDYEGVIRGDQGKNRTPHDHNRDYDNEISSIYPECNAIKEYAEKNGCHFGFDFHSPWHMGDQNDTVFIVQNSTKKLDKLNRFGEIFEECITENSLKYEHKNDYPFKKDWNIDGAQFGNYMTKKKGNYLAFTLETPYFGTHENKVDEDKLLELGRCFAKALKVYIKEKSKA